MAILVVEHRLNLDAIHNDVNYARGASPVRRFKTPTGGLGDVRIAQLSNPELVNSNYRAYHPLDALARRGHELLQNERGRPLPAKVLLEVDVVHVHRETTPEMLVVARELREAGVGLVWDNDDDVTAMPRSNPLYARYGGARSRDMLAGVRKIVRLADIVTTPSEVLAEQYRELGATDVRVLENYLPRQFLKVRNAKHRGVVIVCLAALEHQVDYQQLQLRETLLRLLDAHREVRVVSFGLGLGLRHERYENGKAIPFLDLVRRLSFADVGIAPLADIQWNRARSNVKLKEYGAAGLAWLASPVGPYRGMGEQQGGRLVPDDRWYEELERLVVNARERRKLAKRAAKWAKEQGIERYADRWEAVLREAAERARARRNGGATAAREQVSRAPARSRP
jgi:glycosyltransferase involved in cell wall biosynthesis